MITQTAQIIIDSFIEIDPDTILLLQEVFLYDIPEGAWLELIGLKWAVLQ